MIRANHLIWTVALALTLNACAEDRALVVTGQTMVTLADTFVATSVAMDKGFEEKTITQAQYDEWVTFGRKFQQVYPLAKHLWQIAADHKDATMQAQLVAMVMGMSADLAQFAALVGVK